MISSERTLACVALATVLLSGPARAQGSSEREAVALFEKGRSLAREGRCKDAIAPFLESIRHAEGVGAWLNLGNCYEVIGKPASARRAFARAEELAIARDDKRRAEAAQRARALDKEVSTLEIRVPPSAREPGLLVHVDGEAVPAESWGTSLPVDPGTHVVRLEAPSRPPRTASVDVKPHGDRAVWTAPSPEPAPTPAVVRAPSASTRPIEDRAPDREGSSSPQRTLGLVVGGAGAVGLAAGAVFGVISLNAHASLVGRCPTYPTCPASDRAALDDLNDRARSSGDVSTVAFIAGAALLLGGAALYLTAPRGAR